MSDNYTILQKVKIRLRLYTTANKSHTFDDAEDDIYLNELISSAKDYVKNVRHYPHTWSDDKINADIESKYVQQIVDLVIYDYNKEGIEFESTHSESGVSRQFQSKARICADIMPFVDIF